METRTKIRQGAAEDLLAALLPDSNWSVATILRKHGYIYEAEHIEAAIARAKGHEQMETATKIERFYEAARSGELWGESPEQLLMRCFNCRHAEIHPDSLYIEEPQAGHRLSEDETEHFFTWLADQGIKIA